VVTYIEGANYIPMENNYKKLKEKEAAMKRLLIIFFLLTFFSLFMLSCAKTIGNKVKDEDIKALFENYEYVSN
jgi:hypothetical protein